MPEISLKEWKFVALLSIIMIAIVCFPAFAGIMMKPHNYNFLGFQFINHADTPVYYSWIEQSKEGHFLFKNLFTSENEPRIIFDPFWLGVGVFGKIFNLSSSVTYQLARIFLIPILLGVLYIFISYFIKKENRRKICFLFLIFSSGFGWIVWLVEKKLSLGASAIPMDLWVPEAFTFSTIYNSPHFIASLIIMLVIFLMMLLAHEQNKFMFSVAAGFLALLLFQFHPYHLVTIFSVIGVYYLALCLGERRLKWNLLGYYTTLVIISLPAIFYHLWTLTNFWTRQQFAIQNTCLTPSPFVIFLSYGFIFILACIGTCYLFTRRKNNRELFLVVWFLTQLILIYLPLNFQRRLTAGLHVVVSIIAIYGFYYLKDKKFFLFQKKFLNIILFTVLTFSNCFLIINDLFYYASPPKNYSSYITVNEQGAMNWIKDNTQKESIVFALPYYGNLIPALTLRTAYAGQWGMTAQIKYKIAETVRFLEDYTEKMRSAFLKINGIDYVLYGPREKEFENFKPDQAEYLEKVYENNEVTIYKVLNN